MPKSCMLALLMICFSALSFTQEIPKGVRYKTASDNVNASAKDSLEKALSDVDKTPLQFAKHVIVIGPMLWHEMEPGANQILRDAKPLVAMIPGPKPVVAQGRRMLTEPEKEAFWLALRKLHPDLKSATVRKAKANEISFFWATIPFDIQEPFFTLDTGKQQFVVNISTDEKSAGMFWIDLVGDLSTLAPKRN